MRKKLNIEERLKLIASGARPLFKTKTPEEQSKPTLLDFRLEIEGSSEPLIIDKAKEVRLEQIITLEGKELKWTVEFDPYAERFASIIKEGLTQIKTRPPVFGSRFEQSAILASYMRGYTFTLGCYEPDFEKFMEIFTNALEYVGLKLAHQF